MDKIKPGFASTMNHFSQDAPSEQDETISKIEAVVSCGRQRQRTATEQARRPQASRQYWNHGGSSTYRVWKLGMDGDLMSLASAQVMITHIPQQLLTVC
jgi:hypothetical protein